MYPFTRVRRVNGADDRGTVAVLTAVVAIVIFGVAALAIEITDAYSRNRASQTVADLAAYAGGQDLPDACTALQTAYANLGTNEGENIRDDAGRTSSLAAMNDGDLANGEIQLFTSYPPAATPPGPLPTVRGTGGWLDTGGCPSGVGAAAAYVRVVTPPAERAFAFGLALNGPDSVTLQTSATVGVRSPSGFGPARLMPVLLPAGCGYGSKQVVTGPRPYPVTYTPARGTGQVPQPSILAPDGVTVLASSATPDLSDAFYGPAEIVGGNVILEVRVRNMRRDPNLIPPKFDLHYNVGLGTVRIPGTAPDGLTATLVTGTVAPDGPRFQARYRLTLDSSVTARPGEWRLRAGQADDAVATTPPAYGDPVTFTIEGSILDSGLCGDPVSGDFGVLRIQRAGSPGNDLDVNIARGLDHSITAFAPGTLPSPLPTVPTVCTADRSADGSQPGVPTGALRDLTPSGPVDGANCVYVEGGNSGGAGIMTNGLITGPTSGGPGRLEVTGITPPGPCSNPASGGGWDWKTPIPGNHKILNTVLSCYLTSGSTLKDVYDGKEDSLRPEIFSDPRFFFVPVLNGINRPGSGPDYSAILEFRAAFITSETIDGAGSTVPAANCPPSAQSCNGIGFGNARGGGKQVFSLTTFVFPLSALPTQVDQGSNGDTYVGGTRDFVLFE